MNWFKCFRYITGLWLLFILVNRNNMLRSRYPSWFSTEVMTPLLNKSSTSFSIVTDSICEIPFLIGTNLSKPLDNIVIAYPVTICKTSWSLVNFSGILTKCFKRPANETFGFSTFENRFFNIGWAFCNLHWNQFWVRSFEQYFFLKIYDYLFQSFCLDKVCGNHFCCCIFVLATCFEKQTIFYFHSPTYLEPIHVKSRFERATVFMKLYIFLIKNMIWLIAFLFLLFWLNVDETSFQINW